MGYACYLCRKIPSKEQKISLHKFPDKNKYPNVYKQYRAACNLDERDDTTGLRICSCHFDKNDLHSDFAKQRIKEGAIPRINVPNPKISDTDPSDSTALLEPEILIKYEPPSPGNVNSCDPLLEPTAKVPALLDVLTEIPANAIVKKVHTMDDLDKHFGILYEYVEKQIPITTVTYTTTSDTESNGIHLETTGNSCYPENETEKDEKPHIKSNFESTSSIEEIASSEVTTPKKQRTYFHPRFISEIETTDVETLEGASRIINFVKQKDKEKSLKIRNLHTKNRRLRKRISSLQKQLSDLREQGMISQDAEDTLLVNKGANVVDV